MKTILAMFLSCLTLASLDAAASLGGIVGRTNQDGGSGCGACHGASPPQAQNTSTMSVSISGPTTLAPGASGTYTVTATMASLGSGVRMGLNVDASTGGLSESSANLQIIGTELTHTSSTINTNGSGSASYSFTFTNPAGSTAGATRTLFAVARLGMNGGWRHASNFTITTVVSQFALNVTKAGTGTGTVSSSPAGINCGSDCSESYSSGTSVTLTATPATGSTFAGWSGACSGTGSCNVTMSAARSVTATFTASAPTDLGPITFQGLWWNSPAGSENGWGVNLTHQGNILFATWFTYDAQGNGMWLVMSNGARTGTDTFTGTLFRTTGPAFSAVPFAPGAVATSVGSATFTFISSNEGSFTYTVNGVTQTKQIVRQIFAAPASTCTTGGPASTIANYQDLWWRSPAGSEDGWGVNITHQADILFATWFTYAADGTGQWLVMSSLPRTTPTSSTYTGAILRTRGPAFNSVPWNNSLFTFDTVGTASFTFTSAQNGTFTYTLDGITQSKPIVRQVYSSPASVCRTVQ